MQSDQPGLFGALLIALAGGWAASRILRAPADAFHSLTLGVGGAVPGMMLAGALGLTLNGVGLLIVATAGGLAVLAAWRFISARRARRAVREELAPPSERG